MLRYSRDSSKARSRGRSSGACGLRGSGQGAFGHRRRNTDQREGRSRDSQGHEIAPHRSRLGPQQVRSRESHREADEADESPGDGFRDIVVEGNIELLRIYRKLDQEIVEPDEQQTAVMLDALLTLTMFNSQEGTEAVIQAIRKSFAPQKYQWYSIMNWYAHSHRHSDLFLQNFS